MALVGILRLAVLSGRGTVFKLTTKWAILIPMHRPTNKAFVRAALSWDKDHETVFKLGI